MLKLSILLYSLLPPQLRRGSRQDEQGLLEQLAAIERSVQQLEALHSQHTQHLDNMEGRLNTALTDLYNRHTQS